MGSPKRPNFLIISASDLGFTDIGPYGGEIETPALDRLAREGVTLTGFQTPAASSPTRAMLLSGTDQHIAGVGHHADYMRVHRPYQGKLGYESYLNNSVATLPEILRDQGYYTMMSGKWHLGVKKDQSPHARGFDKSFVYLAGTGNHYNDEPQLGDLVDYLYRHPAVDSEGMWMEDGRALDRVRDVAPGFYSSTAFCDKLLQFLDDRSDEDSAKPFFAYLPLTAPHWPLQAPRETIDKYKGMYDDGPDRLRARRLHTLAEHGLFPRGVGTNGSEASPTKATQEKPWSAMSPAERAHSSRRMETYAAMVDLLDREVGRVIDGLERAGVLDDTMVLFTADGGGGGVGKVLEALPILADDVTGRLPHLIRRFCNNATDNLGQPDSFAWYGSQWSWASAAPTQGLRVPGAEGAAACPCIVRYPRFGLGGGGGSRGLLSHEFATVMDVLPTVLELAGAAHPGRRYRGREIATPRGRSWVSHLRSPSSPSSPSSRDTVRGNPPHPHGASPARDLAKWKVFGRRAVRRGKWKAVFIPAPKGQDAWELYDLSRDARERRNLAAREPEVLEQLLLEWEKYYAETGMYDPGVEENNPRVVPQIAATGGGGAGTGAEPMPMLPPMQLMR